MDLPEDSPDTVPATAPAPGATPRRGEIDRAGIDDLVHAFYARVREDALLGPVFNRVLDGQWDAHLAKLVDFWASIVLGAKTYQGNVQQAHGPLSELTPAHFNRWLFLFFETIEQFYEPGAAIKFMVPALRIAQSLQLSRFGWEYELPAGQRALLDRLAPRPGSLRADA